MASRIRSSSNNACHLMQHGEVDLRDCRDRPDDRHRRCLQQNWNLFESARGARQWAVPFYVAAPSPSIDFYDRGRRRRSTDRNAIAQKWEDYYQSRRLGADGRIETVCSHPPEAVPINYAFDVTPARFVDGSHYRARRDRGHHEATGQNISRANRQAIIKRAAPQIPKRETLSYARARSRGSLWATVLVPDEYAPSAFSPSFQSWSAPQFYRGHKER